MRMDNANKALLDSGKAMPMLSWLDRMVGMLWIGHVLWKILFLFKSYRITTEHFISLKLLMSGGIASPSTKMWYFFTCLCQSPDTLRT